MDLDEFQTECLLAYPNRNYDMRVIDSALGITAEIGEIVAQFESPLINQERRVEKLGHLLYYMAILANNLDYTLTGIATTKTHGTLVSPHRIFAWMTVYGANIAQQAGHHIFRGVNLETERVIAALAGLYLCIGLIASFMGISMTDILQANVSRLKTHGDRAAG